MAAEFQVRFADAEWWRKNSTEIEQRIMDLPTFCTMQGDDIELRGLENRDSQEDWRFDVRILKNDDGYLLEISTHPESIEGDLIALLDWLRERTALVVEDEDGIAADW